MVRRRIYISAPVDKHLNQKQKQLVEAVLDLISKSNFEPQRFLYSGLPASIGWNWQTVDEVMRRCIGAIIFAFPRWEVSDSVKAAAEGSYFPTEYNHYEGAVANTIGLPTLIVVEKGVVNRGIAWNGGGKPILFAPENADTSWLNEDTFRHRFNLWLDQLNARRDIFLGYCSQAKATANAINVFITRLGVNVLDWTEFSAGGNILDEIETAASLCSAGIFLFTKDDYLDEGGNERAAPRDNVVFEAGYFTHAKGRDRVLIIREQDTKMPADVGGNIYLPLVNRDVISSIETQLRTFIEKRL